MSDQSNYYALKKHFDCKTNFNQSECVISEQSKNSLSDLGNTRIGLILLVYMCSKPSFKPPLPPQRLLLWSTMLMGPDHTLHTTCGLLTTTARNQDYSTFYKDKIGQSKYQFLYISFYLLQFLSSLLKVFYYTVSKYQNLMNLIV